MNRAIELGFETSEFLRSEMLYPKKAIVELSGSPIADDKVRQFEPPLQPNLRGSPSIRRPPCPVTMAVPSLCELASLAFQARANPISLTTAMKPSGGLSAHWLGPGCQVGKL